VTRLGIAALAGYGVHAAYHLSRGAPENLLWVCHLAAAWIGVGLIARSRALVSAATLVLCMGTPLWIFDLTQGGEFMPTSLGTHVLGLIAGLYGVTKLGVERGAWRKAAFAIAAIVGTSRIATPAASNVNLAFATPPGMDRVFASHAAYLGTMIAIATAYFWVIEALAERVVRAAKPKEAAP